MLLRPHHTLGLFQHVVNVGERRVFSLELLLACGLGTTNERVGEWMREKLCGNMYLVGCKLLHLMSSSRNLGAPALASPSIPVTSGVSFSSRSRTPPPRSIQSNKGNGPSSRVAIYISFWMATESGFRLTRARHDTDAGGPKLNNKTKCNIHLDAGNQS